MPLCRKKGCTNTGTWWRYSSHPPELRCVKHKEITAHAYCVAAMTGKVEHA